MPIITISRGSYYHGKSIAEKLAARLGYTCLSRDQVVDHLDTFHLPEIKLVRGLSDAFSVLDRFPHGKKKIQSRHSVGYSAALPTRQRHLPRSLRPSFCQQYQART